MKEIFDPAKHGYKDGMWTCEHIRHPDQGVTRGEHPSLDPCPWCENGRLQAEIEVLRKDAERYRYLRDGNAYEPEEQVARGWEELDSLCDEGIARLLRNVTPDATN